MLRGNWKLLIQNEATAWLTQFPAISALPAFPAASLVCFLDGLERGLADGRDCGLGLALLLGLFIAIS